MRRRRDRTRRRRAPQPHDWRGYPTYTAIIALGRTPCRPSDQGETLVCWDVVVPSRGERQRVPTGSLWLFERVLALVIGDPGSRRRPAPCVSVRRGEVRDLRLEQVDDRRWRAVVEWPDGSGDVLESDRPHTAELMHLLDLWVHGGDLTPYLFVEDDS